MNNLEEKRISMLALIEDWRHSGKSKKQYCLEQGINEGKFYYWYSRLNETEKSTPRSFIPIEQCSSVRDIEVFYPNGFKLKVNADLSLLAQLIRLY